MRSALVQLAFMAVATVSGLSLMVGAWLWAGM